MRTLTKHIRYDSRTQVFRIVPFGDLHLGNLACDEKLAQSWVDKIKDDPDTYWVGVGDYAEFIKRRDMRFDPEAVAPWLFGQPDVAAVQLGRLKKLLVPIKDKCLGLVMGNHERDIARKWEHDIYRTLIEILAPDGKQKQIELGFSGFVLLRFHKGSERQRTWTVPLFVTHGWWAGRLYGNGALNLERVFGWVEAQIVLAGHDHKRRAFEITRVKPRNNGGVERIDGFCCSCGSFLDMATYAEQKGYRPLPVGPLEILIQPDKRDIRVVQ